MSIRSTSFLSLLHNSFFAPSVVLICLLVYTTLRLLGIPASTIHSILWLGIAVGSWKLLRDTVESLLQKSFALDYIAILAILVGVATENYVVATIIVLMMAGGNALEEYAEHKAKKSLTALKNRIPNQAQVIDQAGKITTVAIEEIPIGSHIMIRKGEVVPLDGTLEKSQAIFDESSLTGEAYPVTKHYGTMVHSGTVNVGEVATIKTTVLSTDSTYNQIVELVKEAESAKTPFIQLADQLSIWFTLATLVLAGIAYFVSGNPERVLAVLVIATPCPLILATPIALIGGMNAAAQRRIIFKRLAALEVLARVKTVVFDKTGTITIGQPQIEKIDIIDPKLTDTQVLSLASGLEQNSLHPYAKVIVAMAQTKNCEPTVFQEISEHIGAGIQGVANNHTYQLSAHSAHPESQVVLSKDQQPIAIFSFKDELKKSSIEVIKKMLAAGLRLAVFTGDTAKRAELLMSKLPPTIELAAHLSPVDKKKRLAKLQENGTIVAMVGDGINDAPALAAADVGIAFSHQEHTAASSAADIVLFGRDFSGVCDVIQISRQTMHIAKQSMYIGVGLSLLGMFLAAGGLLTPVLGAMGQEIIDVAVILNALRTTKIKTS